MFDRVKLRISTVDENLINSLPIFSNRTMEENGSNFNFKFGCLACRYISMNNSVEMSGSLHKFQMGNNYGDFSYEDIKIAFNKISDAFNIPLDNILIISVEVAINIIPSKPVSCYYKCFKNYQGNSFIPMNPLPGTNKIKGVRSCGSIKILKLYDKTFEAKHNQSITVKALVPDNILRIEIYLKPNYLRQLGRRNTAKDLMNQRAFNAYVRELTSAFIESEKIDGYSPYDFRHLKPTVLAHYLLISSDKYDDYLNTLRIGGHSNKYENKRRRLTLNIISKSTGKHKYIEELNQLFHNKRRTLTGIKTIP